MCGLNIYAMNYVAALATYSAQHPLSMYMLMHTLSGFLETKIESTASNLHVSFTILPFSCDLCIKFKYICNSAG